MLKQKNAGKKKKAKYTLPETSAEQVVCGACNHVREETATNPDWQCPGCGAAYSKVNHSPTEKSYTQTELKKKNTEFLEQKGADELQDDVSTSAGVAAGGVVTYLSGLATACAAANPVVQILGGAIVLGAVIYAISRYLA